MNTVFKKAVIYVFSGSGNTEKLTALYKDEFIKNGVETDVVCITKDTEVSNVDGYDLVGIAYPIHAFNAPVILLEFADKLPKTIDKPLFIVKTSGEPLKLNNISSGKLMHKIGRKGYKLFAEYHYAMPYNMIFRHSDATAYKMWETAKGLAPIEAREVLSNKKHLLERFPFGKIIAFLFRIEQPAMKINGRFFKVDYDKCVLCGKCVKACPENNIKMENGKIVFDGDCTCCVKCSFNCPKDAISIGMLNGWRINGAYDMSNKDAVDDGRHKRYCRRAYERYFAEAAAKIADNKLDNLD